MVISIANLQELEAYVSNFPTRIADIKAYHYLGQGEEFNDAIQAYYNNSYSPEIGGITLFLGIFESLSRDVGGNQSFATVYCQACLIQKADPTNAQNVLSARNKTWETALKFVGTIERDMEDSRFSPTPAKRVRIEVVDNKLIPLEKVANVDAWGWGIEITFTIPVNSLKY